VQQILRMKKLLFWALSVFISLTSTYAQSSINDGKQNSIRKSTSHYYINDSLMVVDSMFITLTYYDKNGKRHKEEETHYLKGKKQRYYTALFKDDDQLLEMRENGKLTLKNEFDSYGTMIKSNALINYNQDTLAITYIPKYEEGRLIQRKVLQKTKLWNNESIEYYTYQFFPDSTIVTSTTKDGYVTSIETKCFDSLKNLLYSTNSLKAPGVNEQSSSFINKYDARKNIIEITELVNNQVVASEKFYYENGKLTLSELRKRDIIIKTVHEF